MISPQKRNPAAVRWGLSTLQVPLDRQQHMNSLESSGYSFIGQVGISWPSSSGGPNLPVEELDNKHRVEDSSCLVISLQNTPTMAIPWLVCRPRHSWIPGYDINLRPMPRDTHRTALR